MQQLEDEGDQKFCEPFDHPMGTLDKALPHHVA